MSQMFFVTVVFLSLVLVVTGGCSLPEQELAARKQVKECKAAIAQGQQPSNLCLYVLIQRHEQPVLLYEK